MVARIGTVRPWLGTTLRARWSRFDRATIVNSRLTYKACSYLLVAVGLLLGDVNVVQAAKRPVVALMTEQRNELPWVVLAEAALAEDDRITLVDREHVDKVLAEQKLTLLMSPTGGAERTNVGQLVGCDILIVLQHAAAPQAVVRVVIADTRTGIRLVNAEFPASFLESKQQLPPELLTAGLKKLAVANPIVLAIPPFTNDDLSRNNQYLQDSLAAVCEAVAARHPRIVLVELDEARDIANENFLTGRATHRALPHYLIGRFRLEATNQRQPPLVTLRLERGSAPPVEKRDKTPTPANIGAFVQAAATELLASLGDDAGGAKVDNAADAAKLAQQAHDFLKIGDFEQGVRLAEASLLLRGDQMELRYVLTTIYLKLVRLQYLSPRMDKQQFDQQFQRALSFGDRGLRHLQIYFDSAKLDRNKNYLMEADFSYFRIHDHTDAKTHYAVWQHKRDRRQIYADTLLAKGKKGEVDVQMMYALLSPALGEYYEFDGPIKEFLTERLKLAAIADRTPEIRPYLYHEILTHGIPESVPGLASFYQSLLESPDKGLAAAADRVLGRRKRPPAPRPAVSIVPNPPQPNPAGNRRPNLANAPRPPVPPPHVTQPFAPPFRVAPVNGQPVAGQPVVDSSLRVRLTPIVIEVDSNGKKSSLCLQGILSDADGNEVAWGFHSGSFTDGTYGERVVLIRNGDQPFRKIFAADNKHSLGVGCFDGKYVWIVATNGGAQLLRIDPTDGAIVKVTADHGLPQESFVQEVMAPLEPGKIVLVAAFGKQNTNRAFVAEVVCQQNTPRVRIVHEAREASIEPDLNKEIANNKTNMNVAYLPKFVLPLRDKANSTPTRVLIARSLTGRFVTSDESLIVDLQSGQAKTSPVTTQSHLTPSNFVIYEGAAYWMAVGNVWRVEPSASPVAVPIGGAGEMFGTLLSLT